MTLQSNKSAELDAIEVLLKSDIHPECRRYLRQRYIEMTEGKNNG